MKSITLATAAAAGLTAAVLGLAAPAAAAPEPAAPQSSTPRRRPAERPAEPPPAPPPEDDEESMLAEAGNTDPHVPRRDPEEAALELLQSELGARRIDGA